MANSQSVPSTAARTTGKRIFINTGWLVLGEVFAKIIVFVFTAILARMLGLQEYGKYTYYMSLVLSLSSLVDGGIGAFLMRESAINRYFLNTNLSFFLLLRFSLSLFLMVCAFPFIGLSTAFHDQTLFVIIFLDATFVGLGFILRNGAKALEVMKFDAVWNVCFNGLVCVTVLASILYLGKVAASAAWGRLLSSILLFVFGWLIFNKKLSPLRWVWPGKQFLRYFSREMLPLAVVSIMIVQIGRLDPILLGIISGSEAQVALYNAPFRLVAMLIFMPAYLTQAAFPALSQFGQVDKIRLRKLGATLIRLVGPLALLASAFLFVFSKEVIWFIYGPEYSSSVPSLRVLSWVFLFSSLSYVLNYMMIAVHKQIVNAWLVGAALLLDMLCNLALVPSLGSTGSAWATLISTAFLFFLQLFWMVKEGYLCIRSFRFDASDLSV